MSERGDRMARVARALVQLAGHLLLKEGADDEQFAAETLTSLGCAYALACKVCDISFDEAEPILRKSFDSYTSTNARGGSA